MKSDRSPAYAPLPKMCQVFNPAFDITPGSLISGIITEKGIVVRSYTEEIEQLFADCQLS